MKMRNILKRINENVTFEFGVIFVLMSLIMIFNREFVHINFKSLYITEFSMLVVVVCYIFSYGLKNATLQFVKPYYIPFALLFLVGMYTLVRSGHSFMAIRQSMIVFYFVLFLIVFQYSFRKLNSLHDIILVVVYLSTFVNAFKIIYFKFNNIYLNEDESFRVMHSEVDILGAVFSLLYLLVYFKKINKLQSILILLLNVSIIVFATKRTALLGLLLCVVVYVLLNFKIIHIRKILQYSFLLVLIIIGLVFLYNYFNPDTSKEYYDFMISKFHFSSEDNVTWRLLAWKVAFNKFLSSPLTGIGFGSLILDTPIRNVNTYDPHNSVLAFFTRTGILGGMVLLYLFVQTAILYLRNIKRESDTEIRKISILYLLLFIFSCTFIFFNVALENQYQGIFIFLSISGIYIIKNHKQAEIKYSKFGKRKYAVGSAMSLIFIYCIGCVASDNSKASMLLYHSQKFNRKPNVLQEEEFSNHKIWIEEGGNCLKIHSFKNDSTFCTSNCINWDIPVALHKSKLSFKEYEVNIIFSKTPHDSIFISLTDMNYAVHGKTYFAKDSLLSVPLNELIEHDLENENIRFLGLDFPVKDNVRLEISSVIIEQLKK